MPPLTPPSTWSDRVFVTAVLVYAALRLLTMSALPLIVSFDSIHYVNLSEILDGRRPWEEWDYFRAPGFPFYLLIVARALGLSAAAFVGMNTLLGIVAASCLAVIVRRRAGRWAAVCCLAVLFAYPLMVGYEHVLLTEVTSTCLIAAVLCLSSTRTAAILPQALLVGTVIGLGWMIRQTAVALVPVAAILVALVHLRDRRRVMTCLLALAGVTGAYAGVTQKWAARAARYETGGMGHLFFIGVVNYGLIDSSLPEFAPAKAAYDELRRAEPDTSDIGYTDLKIMGIRAEALRSFKAKEGSIALRSVLHEPIGYLGAVAKNLRLMYGLSQSKSENANWPIAGMTREVDEYGNIRVGPPLREKADSLFKTPFKRGAVARGYARLIGLYRVFVAGAAAITLLGGLWMLWRRAWVGALLNLTPHYLIALHAALLTGIDRYAYPMYPAMLAMAIWTAGYLWQTVQARGRLTPPVDTMPSDASTTEMVADSRIRGFARSDWR